MRIYTFVEGNRHSFLVSNDKIGISIESKSIPKNPTLCCLPKGLIDSVKRVIDGYDFRDINNQHWLTDIEKRYDKEYILFFVSYDHFDFYKKSYKLKSISPSVKIKSEINLMELL